MIRNLKVLGLALGAVFALAVAVASTASAAEQGTLTSTGPVTLTATETGEVGSNALTAFGGRVECPGSTYTGHKYNVTPHELITVPATTVTITPKYKEPCSVNGGEREMTVEMNGCDYVLHLGTTIPPANNLGTYGVTATIVCPETKKIHLGVWENGAKHEVGNRICTMEVGAQTLGEHVHVTNTPLTDDFDISGTFTNLKATEHGLCVLLTGTTDNACKTDIDLTVTGDNALGQTTEVHVTD